MSIHISVDMSTKKKLIWCMSVLSVFLLWYTVFGGKSDTVQYAAMKQSMVEYESLLRETREQILDRLKMCQRECQRWDPDLPVIYTITPTYARPVQKAELTRLSQTLMHISNLHWIVIEDAAKPTPLVVNLLARTNLNYTHLTAQTPPNYRRKGSPRGVEQRNAALRWLRKNKTLNDKGVVYFADDDNSYSVQVFDEMRFTKEVSVWPVGLVGGLLVEKPVLDPVTGKVAGWNAAWRPDRPFPIDMAGFAISLSQILKRSAIDSNLNFHTHTYDDTESSSGLSNMDTLFKLQKRAAYFSYTCYGGWQESHILQQLTTKDHLEPKADNCTQILVWHTRTEAPKLSEENKLAARGMHSDVGVEV